MDSTLVNNNLQAIYSFVYDESFYNNDDNDEALLDKHVKLQKAIYLLQESGVPSCGSFYFTWDKLGPYSPELGEKVKEIREGEADCSEINSSELFSVNEQKKLTLLKCLLNLEANDSNSFPRTNYNQRLWAELVGSIHFLKTYVFLFDDDETINEKLRQVKPHLSIIQSNVFNDAWKCLRNVNMLSAD